MEDFQKGFDQANFNSKECFYNFIKTKKIDELITFDNKLFSEVRNLESEKHILVTQNYKKFVSATETINSIKSSLVNFEKDLSCLQSKVNNIVSNFKKINQSIEGKLKQTEEIYKIKKDLKRLKFINDLPSILENQLNLYMNDKGKNLNILEKSLRYFEKCKEFLKIHKDNYIVKEIYQRASELIYKYHSIINDQMNILDFNEYHLDKFELCLFLLVKIEDDPKDLIKIFLEKYQNILNTKLDNIFAMKAGVNEIDYDNYMKIYDNYEFAINEKDFKIYEEQLMIQSQEKGIIDQDQHDLIKEKYNDINISALQSKMFKIGTFIWVCKKVIEEINNKILVHAYEIFLKLFGEKYLDKLNLLFKEAIQNFYFKISLFIKDINNNNSKLDPIFFKEGLISYSRCFKVDLFNLIKEERFKKNEIIDLINKKNLSLINDFLVNYFEEFMRLISLGFKENLLNLFDEINKSKENLGEGSYPKFSIINKEKYLEYVKKYFVFINKSISLYSRNIRLLGIENFNESGILINDLNGIYLKLIISLFDNIILVLESNNPHKILKLDQIQAKLTIPVLYSSSKYMEKNYSLKSIYKNYIIHNIYPLSIEKIYFCMLFLKELTNQANIQSLIVNMTLSIPELKKNKNNLNYLTTYIDNSIRELKSNTYDGLILLLNEKIYSKLKVIFYEPNYLLISSPPITFREELKKFCYDLFFLKLDLNEIFEEEANIIKENKVSLFRTEGVGNKIIVKKNLVEIEMEKLQVRRLSIYGDKIDSSKMLIYIIVKILLKTINEFIKLKKFSGFAAQQIQIDLFFVKYFYKENLHVIDKENILDAFIDEILRNVKYNTIRNSDQGDFSEDLINEILMLHEKEFNEISLSIMDKEDMENKKIV